MATKKKTTVQELKELIEATPKAKTLTEDQFKKLEDIYMELSDIRRNLGELEGEDNPSKIMFQVGSTYTNIDKCEDELRDIINSFEEDCDDCDDNNW
jgi:pyruvate/2-oxoacid:ferredoxin oxidoreductase alpha subunit